MVVRYLLTFIFIFKFITDSFAQEDTLQQEVDSVRIMDDQEEKKVIRDIHKFSEEDNLLSQLLGRILVNPSSKINQWDYSYHEFDRYDGKIIRDITIDTREVFGPEPADTSYQSNLIDKAGDFFHIKTRKWIVRNQLLFHPGERLVPFQLAESERLLRSRDYLFDASIKLIPVGKDSVDVIVTTRDLWSISPGLAWDRQDHTAEISIKENNFLGLGFTTTLGFLFGDRYSPKGWDYEGAIRFENLFARYLHFDLVRDVDQFGSIHKIKGQRKFETPLIDVAGGFEYQWYDKAINLITRDSILLSDQQFRSQEYWLGYGSSLFDPYDFQNEYYVAAGFQRMEYQNHRQEMTSDHFHDNSLILAKIGYAFRRFNKTRFVIGLGRNEDIPVGSIFTLTGGYLHGSEQHKWYTGVKTGYSFFNKNLGYLSLLAEAGSFIYQKNLNEYIYRLDMLYFTNLYRIGGFRLRHFLRLEYAAIDQPNQLSTAMQLDDERGIRGFDLNYFGNKKILLNYELNLFPPLKFLGFNFAGVGFADAGFLADRGEPIWKGRFLSGFGIGFKVRNENLIFQSIQIMLGYYPQTVVSNPQLNLFSQQRNFYNFEKYRFEKPGIIVF